MRGQNSLRTQSSGISYLFVKGRLHLIRSKTHPALINNVYTQRHSQAGKHNCCQERQGEGCPL